MEISLSVCFEAKRKGREPIPSRRNSPGPLHRGKTVIFSIDSPTAGVTVLDCVEAEVRHGAYGKFDVFGAFKAWKIQSS